MSMPLAAQTETGAARAQQAAQTKTSAAIILVMVFLIMSFPPIKRKLNSRGIPLDNGLLQF